jgi:DNA-binding FadR family transcriptional regulator
VFETRVRLERSSVVLASGNATPQNLAPMRAALLAIDEPDLDRETFNRGDTDFHVAPVDAGGNSRCRMRSRPAGPRCLSPAKTAGPASETA